MGTCDCFFSYRYHRKCIIKLLFMLSSTAAPNRYVTARNHPVDITLATATAFVRLLTYDNKEYSITTTS